MLLTKEELTRETRDFLESSSLAVECGGCGGKLSADDMRSKVLVELERCSDCYYGVTRMPVEDDS